MFIMLFTDSDKSGEDIEIYQLPDLTASQVVDALSEWDGVENVISAFQDLVLEESGNFCCDTCISIHN